MSTERYLNLLLVLLTVGSDVGLCTEEFRPKDTHACPRLPKLPLPGSGWDSLQDKQMSNVFRTDYSKCKTTLDARFLIPDAFDSIVIKHSDVQLSTDMTEHWMYYSNPTSRSFNMDLGLDLTIKNIDVQISASFSSDYQELKSKMMKSKSILVRVSMQYKLYEVMTTPSASLDDQVEKLFEDVIDALRDNNTDRAECLLEFLVRDYGTHYITKIYAGAMLLQENYLEIKQLENSEGFVQRIKAAAGVLFFDLVKLPQAGGRFSTSSKMIQEYNNMRASSRTRTFGGPKFSPGMTAKEWQEGITDDDLDVIDKTGDPIFYLITPARFPDLDPEILETMQSKLKAIVQDYMMYNAHAGCMNPVSENFDPVANIEGPCQDSYEGYKLGGTYIDCTLNSYSSQAGDPCSSKSYRNPLTGDYSCPEEFTHVQINSWQVDQTQPQTNCEQKCSGWWVFKKCDVVCNPQSPYTSRANLNSYWCAPKQTKGDGYVFGGVFSTTMNNIYTGKKTCPPTYIELQLSESSWVCVTTSDQGQPIKFGGFFSCKSGNPLASDTEFKTPKGCPSGFSQSIATIDNHCQISYCYKPLAKPNYKDAKLMRPPFKDVDSRLLQRNDSPTKSSAGYTDYGVIAGIILMFIIIIVIVSMSMYVYVYKRRHANDHGQQLLISLSESNDHQPRVTEPFIPKPAPITAPIIMTRNWGNVVQEMQIHKNPQKPKVPPKKPSLQASK